MLRSLRRINRQIKMQRIFQEILEKMGMVADPEAPNESIFIQESTEGYVKTHLELLPEGRVKVSLESTLPLFEEFEEPSEKVSSRIINAQRSLLPE